jgi:uncharacterized protein (UPF0332 family)
MISDTDRKSLIDYRMKQAYDTIELAKFLAKNQKFNIAVNRVYYEMYYALTALALKHRFETSKHGQLIGWFNQEFVAKGKTDSSYGKMLRNAFQSRTKGDYDAFVEFSSIEIEIMLVEMEKLISEVQKLIFIIE